MRLPYNARASNVKVEGDLWARCYSRCGLAAWHSPSPFRSPASFLRLRRLI